MKLVNYKVEYNAKEESLKAKKIHFLRQELSHDEFMAKYQVYVNIEIYHDVLDRNRAQLTYPSELMIEKSTAPGRKWLTKSEIEYLKTSWFNGINFGRYFFDEGNEWKLLEEESDFYPFTVRVFVEDYLQSPIFPYLIHIKIKELENEN